MNYKKISLLMLLTLFAFQLQAQRPSQYKLKVGEKFTVTAEIQQDITQSMLGQQIETEQTITTVDQYEVVAVSRKEIKMKTTGISRSMRTETGGGFISMDSDMEGDENLAFRVLTNKSYYVVINQYGRFLRFEGMDQFKAQVRNELDGTALDGQTDQLLTAFSDETLGTAVDGQFYIYKEPGKDWNRSATMVVNNMPISVDYTFSRVDAQTISATGNMTLSGDFEVMGNMMSADMDGDQTSYFKLNPKTGLPTSIKTTQNMDGSLEVQDMSVPMTLKTEVTVTFSR